jgi:hypothetical protein
MGRLIDSHRYDVVGGGGGGSHEQGTTTDFVEDPSAFYTQPTTPVDITEL